MEGYRRFKCSNSRTFCETCRRRIKVDEWVQAKPPEGHKGWSMTRCYPSCQEALTRAYVPPDPKRLAELLAPKIRTFRFKVLDRYPRSACVRCFRFFEDGEMIDAEVSMGSIWRNLRHHTRCSATLTSAVMMRNASNPNRGNPSTPTRGNSSTLSRGSALASGHGNALTPSRGNPSTPSRGSASTPTRDDSSTSSRSYASTPNRANASTPSRSSASTPTRGRALTPIGTERGLDAWRTHESEKRRLSSHAPRVLFGTDHMINEAEPPRSRRRLCPYTSESARISSAPASSAFSGSSAAAVAGALKDVDDDADSVECLGDIGIDEQLAQRQKEKGVVDLTGEFNAVG